MAMYDPRMKQLVEQEGLKGLGAYWVIIEKLSLLPEPRAQQDFLRPYCDRKKIKLSYLLKIICEYELFDIDEEGFFMPRELNPSRKKEKKASENGEKVPVFDAKKHEKSQKTARKNTKISRRKIAKNMNNSELENKSASHLKENIKDNIKTAAATKNKKTAAAADDNNASHPQPAGKKEPPFAGWKTAVTVRPLRPWRELVNSLPHESLWLDIACMKSGYGALLKRRIHEAIEIFTRHIEAYGKGSTLLEMRDVQSYFVNYVSAGSRTSRMLYEALLALERKQQEAVPNPYRYELRVNGKRTYMGCPIPDDAPPRPNETAVWSDELHAWLTADYTRRKPAP